MNCRVEQTDECSQTDVLPYIDTPESSVSPSEMSSEHIRVNGESESHGRFCGEVIKKAISLAKCSTVCLIEATTILCQLVDPSTQSCGKSKTRNTCTENPYITLGKQLHDLFPRFNIIFFLKNICFLETCAQE